MNRPSQHGIALVITLIMLSVVTFMAVIFLALSRRERASVKISEDQNTARLMADSAVARVQAQVVAGMLANNNRLAYDFFISTNYINPAGYKSQGGNRKTIVTNVNYFQKIGGGALSRADYQQNIANLQIDPRPPVFATTNKNTPYSDFRFFLDYNRNGLFEPTGFFRDTDRNGVPPPLDKNFYPFIGDPQWVGVLEHPDQPHSETNRFVGRWAFLALPVGKSLDLNYIHNDVRNIAGAINLDARTASFARNQGVGSYEINLAGYFRGLNTNVWTPADYRGYDLPVETSRPAGKAFTDALGVLAYRYSNTVSSLRPLKSYFNGPDANNFKTDQIDTYGDGPVSIYGAAKKNPALLNDDDPITRPWPGSENPNGLVDVQEILAPKGSALWDSMADALQTVSKRSLASYDRYTLYRSLGQLGVDSIPAVQDKVHLNYANYPGKISTNLHLWSQLRNDRSFQLDPTSTPYTNFFLMASDSMLRASVATNVTFKWTNWFGFQSFTTNHHVGFDRLSMVRPQFSLTNIQIYHTAMQTNLNVQFSGLSNEYTAPVHRVLQVAANIYDNMTNRGRAFPYLPSVFRPIFAATPTNVFISGWVEETNANFVANPWRNARDLIVSDPAQTNPVVSRNINVFGQAVVIGAKKGWPNFNEFAVDLKAEVTRKLEFVKRATNAPVTTTNQMHLLGLQGLFGVEAWNSYKPQFPRALHWHVSLQSQIALYATNNGVRTQVWPLNRPFQFTLSSDTNLVWDGFTNRLTEGIKLPIFTNILMLADNNALLRNFPYFTTNSTNGFERSFAPPTWVLDMTNYVQYWLTDPANNAVVDFVNLGGLVTKFEIANLLQGSQPLTTSELVNSNNAIGPFLWNPALSQSNVLASPTVGVAKQIDVSLGRPSIIDETTWKQYSIYANDKSNSIVKFRDFVSLSNTTDRTSLGLRQETPFNPTRVVVLHSSWQANDPLVHYTASDLFYPTANAHETLSPTELPFRNSDLGKVNRRYSPWKKSFGLQTTDASPFVKDPGITRSDDWVFPIDQSATTNTFHYASIGWLGAVHRGTPWQTVYLKAEPAKRKQDPDLAGVWRNWNTTDGTYPTLDYNLLGVFTAAPNENATRGLLSVNQGNYAAWSAVLSGVPITVDNGRGPTHTLSTQLIQPATDQIRKIVDGMNITRATRPGGAFSTLGDILRTPQLSASPLPYGGVSLYSPFLNISAAENPFDGLTDEAVESIPRQILGLLKVDEPRYVVYAYGQSLKPAERSITTDINFYNLCTNYQVTGEVVTKTIFRVEGTPGSTNNPLRTVVEGYSVLPPTE